MPQKTKKKKIKFKGVKGQQIVIGNKYSKSLNAALDYQRETIQLQLPRAASFPLQKGSH